jgi:hypothetical protein
MDDNMWLATEVMGWVYAEKAYIGGETISYYNDKDGNFVLGEVDQFDPANNEEQAWAAVNALPLNWLVCVDNWGSNPKDGKVEWACSVQSSETNTLFVRKAPTRAEAITAALLAATGYPGRGDGDE